MIEFRPDRTRYDQVADVIRSRIAEGVYRPGMPVPSINRLCQEFGIARVTAGKVVTALQKSGHAYTIPNLGTFVMTEEKRRELGGETESAEE
ncbi:winged helix-turn-helix domain-containing protein [Streptosporangium sp. NPDC049248]|uniref:GntR family transcriptional regulator n=1 Tax=Streptosporangium sp. NPDC049248 TaxID=3155651 RepID=UPI00343C1D2E